VQKSELPQVKMSSGNSVSMLKLAVVCSSNMNRSMEAHAFLAKKGYDVDSYGTGDKVKLPGPSADKPNVYEFGTSYEEIYEDLSKRDKSMYTQNGILNMLDRNRRIKRGPQRLQATKRQYDIILTAEERVYDQVLHHFAFGSGAEDGGVETVGTGGEGSHDDSGISLGGEGGGQAVHVVNIDIQDNHEEATIGAFLFNELVSLLANSPDLDDEIDEIILQFERRCNRPILHTIVFY